MRQSAPTRRQHGGNATNLDPMTDQDRRLRARLGSAAIVVAGLLLIALLVQGQSAGQGWNPTPVELGSEPVRSVSCEWAGDVEPNRRYVNLVGVLEATVRLDTADIFDHPSVDFDPGHVWLHVEVHEGPRSRGLQQRLSPHELADGPDVQDVTVRFDAIYDEHAPEAPTCEATLVVS